MMLLLIPIVTSIEECKRVMNTGDVPCTFITSMKGKWIYTNDCDTYTVEIYDSTPTLLDSRPLGTHQNTRCNLTFNYTEIGSYLLNFSSRETAKIIIEEDNNMLIALVIGISIIVALFIFLTFAVKEDYPFLANFFFLGIFIFTTVLSNLLWKITNINSAPYEPIMFIVYRIFLIVTMLMMFIILLMLTIESVKLRKWKGNPIDAYRDNLGKDEKDKF